MNENLENLIYFGTPIYLVEIPELVNELNKISDPLIKESKNKNKDFIKNREKIFKKKLNDFGITYHSGSLINLQGFKKLKNYVYDRSIEILDHMGYDLKDHILKYDEFWVQEFSKNGGCYHETHTHPNTHISGFYFLKCSDKTSMPVFHDPRLNKVATQLPLKNIHEITFGSQHINFIPKPGTLVLFPSFLQHQFTIDFGIDTFRFIHFNLQAVKKNEL
jgi:hypothetical protein